LHEAWVCPIAREGRLVDEQFDSVVDRRNRPAQLMTQTGRQQLQDPQIKGLGNDSGPQRNLLSNPNERRSKRKTVNVVLAHCEPLLTVQALLISHRTSSSRPPARLTSPAACGRGVD
jgi:hypothetical protein